MHRADPQSALGSIRAHRLVAPVVGDIPQDVAGHDGANADRALDFGAVVDLVPDVPRRARLAEDPIAGPRIADRPGGQFNHLPFQSSDDGRKVDPSIG